ncbi:MAG: hypothetical protein WC023_05750 [Rhodocyclaceae bacterium]|jgi:3-hydroxymyristoyl/3-hydroxydecanoyl-(acyl carrier protein) dehydratase
MLMTECEFFWTVAADHPAFAGHFPGQPIVPGVLILDHALHCAAQLHGAPGGHWQIGNTKFLSPVGPGERLTFTLQRRPSGAIAFAVRADKRDIASGSLTPCA